MDRLTPQHLRRSLVGRCEPRTSGLASAASPRDDYVVNLRTQIVALIHAGGDINDTPRIDQPACAHLDQFDALSVVDPMQAADRAQDARPGLTVANCDEVQF